MQVNVAEAKAKLSELMTRAERGEDVVIARGGKPVIKLTVIEPKAARPSVLGVWAHRVPPGTSSDLLDDPEWDQIVRDYVAESAFPDEA